jgi:hypothetical protein
MNVIAVTERWLAVCCETCRSCVSSRRNLDLEVRLLSGAPSFFLCRLVALAAALVWNSLANGTWNEIVFNLGELVSTACPHRSR